LTFPKPAPAQVIRYSYLWHQDAIRGAEEGSKDRPCAIIMMVQDENGEDVVTVLPITHTPPNNPADALEIPHLTKQRLGLDNDRSWVVITESNQIYEWYAQEMLKVCYMAAYQGFSLKRYGLPS
jgi:hypothetical protein